MIPTNIFISTPCYTGKVDINYHVSMLGTMKFLGERRIQHMFNYAVSTGVDAARSKHATEFLRTDCSHLMMIDDDMAWAPDLVYRLLAEDVDVIGVPYRRKIVTPARFTARHDYALEHKENKPYMVKVDGLGTGMMLVKRHVIEELAKTAPAIQYAKDGPVTRMIFRHEFIEDPMIGAKTYMSEDYNFCRLARENGFEVWAYVDEDVAHIGNVAYRGEYAQVLEQGIDKKLRNPMPKMQVRLVGDPIEETMDLNLTVEVNGEMKTIAAQCLKRSDGLLLPNHTIADRETPEAKAFLENLRATHHTEDTSEGIMVYDRKQ